MNFIFDTRIIILISSLLQGLAGIRLVRFSVPAYKMRGESALLECLYELTEKTDDDDDDGYHHNSKRNSDTNLDYTQPYPVGGVTRIYNRLRSHQHQKPHRHRQRQYHPNTYESRLQLKQAQQSTHRLYEKANRQRGYHNNNWYDGGGVSGARDNNNFDGTLDVYSVDGEGVASNEFDRTESLYAVKWYKDNEEFYRFVPKANPQKQSYRVDGIRVIDEHSDSTRVLLKGLMINSTGLYRCEVSAEAPNFSSAHGESQMDVVYLPRDGPHIRGQQSQYRIGDILNLNCTSGKSHPASNLRWFINDQPFSNDSYVIQYNNTVHRHGLITSILGLELPLESYHFDDDGEMKVKCIASMGTPLWRKYSENRRKPRPAVLDNWEAMLLVHGSSTMIVQNWNYVISVIILNVISQLFYLKLSFQKTINSQVSILTCANNLN